VDLFFRFKSSIFFFSLQVRKFFDASEKKSGAASFCQRDVLSNRQKGFSVNGTTRGARYLTGENLEVVRAEFSTVS
jgi:hypothetical protein